MRDKTIVLVGGTSGIGQAVLQHLSDRGASVRHLSRAAALPENLPGVEHTAWDAASDAFPADSLPDRIDGLVYCPGSIRLRPFARLKIEEFTDDFRISFLGAVKAIQACLTPLKRSESGASIVLFSTVAVQTGMPFHASVAGAKGAVEGLTRSLAAELAPRIRVNAIAPSLTDTPLAAGLLGDDARRKASADRHPLKRVGTPADMAAAAAFLLDASAAWITGQVIPVDGGMGAIRLFR